MVKALLLISDFLKSKNISSFQFGNNVLEDANIVTYDRAKSFYAKEDFISFDYQIDNFIIDIKISGLTDATKADVHLFSIKDIEQGYEINFEPQNTQITISGLPLLKNDELPNNKVYQKKQDSNNNNNNTTSKNENVNRNETVQKIEQDIKSPPPSAIAPSIGSSYSQDLCTVGIGGAVQTQLFGLSGGGSVRDENCERIKLSKTLYDMGMKVASVSLMCQDQRVWDAMRMAGTPCPYNGLIGSEAQAAWDENQEDRPDWDQVKKEQASHEFKAYTKPKFCKKYPTHKICTNS